MHCFRKEKKAEIKWKDEKMKDEDEKKYMKCKI